MLYKDQWKEYADKVVDNRKVQALKVKPAKKIFAFKQAKIKGKGKTISKKKAYKISGAHGTLSFAKVSGNALIQVSEKGKITVSGELSRGTKKVKIAVSAAGNANYKPASKQVTIKIKVK